MTQPIFQYELFERAIWPIHSIDGDTTRYVEDDGRRSYTVRTERDLGINTPELHSPDPALRAKAIEAKQFREEWFAEHVQCNKRTISWPRIDANPAPTLFSEFVEIPYFILRTASPDSFDRWLSTIRCQAGHTLQQDLLDAGLAELYTPH